ncbi:ABC transporter ATP-binding protein [Telmatospirillum siberiense]|uniref:Peptide ABC transporter ATP-binding protein n=1 Tax=Telmatospirillum siberiense TaxID=382514 RepID=A0A2N3PZH1_9PROT|nr:ABC transporter ATP-binding protein [Telmatospirillum siberiense]PKU25779.1 peptide ABC transporter ATP-binding protein [Telmatospirillum siberiense]
MSLLDVKNLSISFATPRGRLAAVRDLSFSLKAGETLALVGESGCGKSLTALALLGLLEPPAVMEGNGIFLEGRNLLTLDEPTLRSLRGSRIAMIFQEPMTALNPVLTVGEQIMEVITEHEGGGRRAARARAVALMEKVRIPDAERRFAEYPHRLSGGLRQRVMIAMALACSPAVLIADEPTTALDVTIQAQILDLIGTLKRENGTAVLFITHDLGLVGQHADRVMVMYAGRVVEERTAADLFADPLHPYTRGLIAARPGLGGSGRRERLMEIPGTVPGLGAMPVGCAFSPRCAFADDLCRSTVPTSIDQAGGRIACHHSEGIHDREPAIRRIGNS